MNGDRDAPQTDLEWLAFRYVAGEMVAEEARSLEERMATDQAAREAVSRAVALGLELEATKPFMAGGSAVDVHVTRRPRALRLRAPAWSAAGTAASVALVVGAYLAWKSNVDWGKAGRPSVAEAPKVAATEATAWLELRKVGDSVAQIERGLDEWKPDEITEPRANSDPAVVPRWLVRAAIAGEGEK